MVNKGVNKGMVNKVMVNKVIVNKVMVNKRVNKGVDLP